MTDRPLVSFVIPVRNDAHRLHVCLESIRANDYPRERVQIIVVDNGSIDDSASVARQAGATVISVPDACVSVLRNRGAECATGDVLAFVDADHVIGSDWIHSAASVLSVEDVAATGAPCTSPPAGTWVQRRYDLLRHHPQSYVDVDWLGSGNMAVKRSFFDRAGGFDSRLAACEDVDLCIRIRASGGRIVSGPTLRSVHHGDPSTLLSLFQGELWRGRDNLRVSFRGPWNRRTLRSALVPLFGLLTTLSAPIAWILGREWFALLCAAWLPAIAMLRTAFMIARDRHRTIVGAVQTFLVAVVYDASRALAVILRASHHRRRPVDPVSHVTANSRT
jgi:glycosyltransferase involved in cell wall biosynthesis